MVNGNGFRHIHFYGSLSFCIGLESFYFITRFDLQSNIRLRLTFTIGYGNSESHQTLYCCVDKRCHFFPFGAWGAFFRGID